MTRRSTRLVIALALVLVILLATVLIVPRTAWFRTWLKNYTVETVNRYLAGELSIGDMRGGLLDGVLLSDVHVSLDGEDVIAIDEVDVRYSVFDFITRGLVLDRLRVTRPVILLERTQEGWNLGRLIRPRERGRDEPRRRMVSVGEVVIDDGRLDIRGANDGLTRVPERIDLLDAKFSVDYCLNELEIGIEHVSFLGRAPDFRLHTLAGTVVSGPGGLLFDQLRIRLDETNLIVTGSVSRGERPTELDLDVKGAPLSFREIGLFLPGFGLRPLTPTLDARLRGTTAELDTTFRMRSDMGAIDGNLTGFLTESPRRLAGEADLHHANLAPLFPDAPTDVTGHIVFNLSLPANGRPVMGRYDLSASQAMAVGYHASNVDVRGEFSGAEFTVDGSVVAYGAHVQTAGRLALPVAGRPFTFDLQGRAQHVNLLTVPAHFRAPPLASDLDIAHYHARRTPDWFQTNAILRESSLEGATFADNTHVTIVSDETGVTFAAGGRAVDVDVERFAERLNLGAIDDERFRSRLDGLFEVEGRYRRAAPLTLRAHVDVTDSVVPAARLPAAVFDVHLENRALAVQGAATFAGLDLHQALGAGGGEGWQALTTSLDGHLRGQLMIADLSAMTPDTVTASGEVTLDRSTVQMLELTSARLSGSLADRIATFTEFRAAGPMLSAEVKGTVSLDEDRETNLTYHVNLANLEPLVPATIGLTRGTLTVDGTLSGDLRELRSVGTLEAIRLCVRTSEALYVGSRFDVSVPWSPARQPRWGGVPGSPARQPRWGGMLDLDVKNTRVHAETTAAFLNIGDVRVTNLRLTTTYTPSPDPSASGAGCRGPGTGCPDPEPRTLDAAPGKNRADGRVRGPQLEFDALVQEGQRELQGTGTLVWHPDHQEMHLTAFAARTEAVEWQLAPPDEMAIRYGANWIDVDRFTLVRQDQRLTLEGKIPLLGPQPGGELRIRAEQIDLAELDQLFGFERGAAGRLTAAASVQGSLADPQISADLTLTGGRFARYTFEHLTASFRPRNGRLDVDARLQQSPTEWITITGSVPRTLVAGRLPGAAGIPDDALDLRVQTTPTGLGLGLIQGFTTAVRDVQGQLQADIRVTGTGRNPHLDGQIDIRNGAFTVADTGVSYAALDTTLRLDGDRLQVQAFNLRDNGGDALEVTGALSVQARHVETVDLAFVADGFKVIDSDLGDIEVTTRMQVTGSVISPRVTGLVEIADGRLEVDRLLELIAERRRAAARPQPASDVQSDTPGVALDLRVDIPDNLVVRGSDILLTADEAIWPGNLNATIGGSVQLMREPGGPTRVVGTINTVRGAYQFQGRQFDVERNGTVRFQGGAEIDPFFNITALRTISGVEARVHIRGSLREPELTLSSRPPLDNTDILALIVFNQPLNQLGSEQRVSLAERAGALASGLLTAPLAASINEALGLDRFEIGAAAADRGLVSAITLGEQVGAHLFVKFTQQVGARDVSEFVLEYRFTDYLRLQTSVTEGGKEADRALTNRTEQATADLIYVITK